ncbi:hypothetical protein [Chondromyces apiculatus]|uniref:Phosphoenolpyruvate synthase n=1 Tax=Chondromyces apiculatus DSM 436 TaxID=1192034 RepID=A0A017T1I6_9BACT|nr:hypothetical protein [Chondromyces apiculatus]EYF03109.1 phosphoenolpyruvate synthase [Chondromyces apiculatus DSM 436]
MMNGPGVAQGAGGAASAASASRRSEAGTREAVEGGRPLSRFVALSVMRALPRGLSEGAARYGMVLGQAKLGAGDGRVVFQAVLPGMLPGMGGGRGGASPRPLDWMVELKPSMRARLRVCQRAFETQRWRAELRLWDRVDRPLSVARHMAIQAVDPSKFGTEGLIAHLGWVRVHVEDMVAMHHRYDFAAGIPVGDYLAHACAWTGASTGEALALVEPASTGAVGVTGEEVLRLAGVLRGSAAGVAALEKAGSAREVLTGLAGLPEAAGEAARGHLEAVRFRCAGHDVSEPMGEEMPEMHVEALRRALEKALGAAAEKERAERERALRQRVPEAHRAGFDGLLQEARAMSRLREERAVFSVGWGMGLARRAVLEAGARLVRAGALEAAEHAVEMTLEEMAGRLRGGVGPDAAEVKRRVEARAARVRAEAARVPAGGWSAWGPAWMHVPLAPPPSAEALPACVQRLARATQALALATGVVGRGDGNRMVGK